MNNAPKLSAQEASGAQDELEDRRRPGRPKYVNPSLIPLLRDPAGGEAGAADGLDESARAYYLAREERFRSALGMGASRSIARKPLIATVFSIAGRFVPEFRERRPEEAYHDDKYIGRY